MYQFLARRALSRGNTEKKKVKDWARSLSNSPKREGEDSYLGGEKTGGPGRRAAREKNLRNLG